MDKSTNRSTYPRPQDLMENRQTRQGQPRQETQNETFSDIDKARFERQANKSPDDFE